jgi:ergothioneine biosynthesis protein EgtB
MSNNSAPTRDPAAAADLLARRFRAVRARSLRLVEALTPEDTMLQSMPDASPSKWHLAHTTWFYERFVLAATAGYVPVDASWDYLYNSYYDGVGPRLARSRRGLVSRPTLSQVIDYRGQVDERLERRIAAGDLTAGQLQVLLLGTHHEQQHQELLLTDIKHALWSNPVGGAYRDRPGPPAAEARADPAALHWHAQEEGLADIGAAAWPGVAEFAFDNETPRHRVFVASHALANRLVTNAEYGRFVAAGGYGDPSLWLSDGWALVESEGWKRPLYWHEDGEREFTLDGWLVRDDDAPACHLSFFEADAFARWAGARLPTEAEWERAAAKAPCTGNFLDTGALHPSPAPAGEGITQLYGDAWEWTASAYTAYPGFVPLPGSLGEYNGKFMNGQRVLRGGSCATPAGHVRASYRNFFPPAARWQFSGVRLAKDLP